MTVWQISLNVHSLLFVTIRAVFPVVWLQMGGTGSCHTLCTEIHYEI